MKYTWLVRFVTVMVAVMVIGGMASSDPGVYSKIKSESERTLITIGNRYEELTFEPSRGGRCISFKLRDINQELIPKEPTYGMFIDHWAKYSWPSGLMFLPYQYKIVGDGKTRVGIEEFLTVPAMGGGPGSPDRAASLSIPTPPELIGLTLKKTIWLRPENDSIQVDEEVGNPTNESRSAGLYVQHAFNNDAKPLNNMWYMPSTNGVATYVMPKTELATIQGNTWDFTPTAGWIAVRNRDTNRGLVFAFDYNYLQKIYTCGASAEWFLENLPIETGKTFDTTYYVKPVQGFADFAHVSKHVITDLLPKEIKGGVEVSQDITAAGDDLSNVKVEFTVVDWKSKELLAKKEFVLAKIGSLKSTQEFTFVPKRLTDGVVISVKLVNDTFDETYEYYYAGDKADYARKYFPTATPENMGALPGGSGTQYAQKQPRQIKKIDKPDFARIPGPASDQYRILTVFGLYTQILNIDDALQGWKYNTSIAPEFTWINCPPNGIEGFPGSYAKLFQFNTIILSDVNRRALGDISSEMLCDFVEQGGNLLVSGGPYAFGNGEFQDTRFLQMLPVSISGPFDLKWAGKGASWDLMPAHTSSSVLQGVSFAQKPKVFWHHFVSPKQGSEVVLNAGDHPALILGRYGKGKIAVLTLSPTGEATKGETEWWAWDGWSALVKNVFTWFGQGK